jgi:hypothetical protein
MKIVIPDDYRHIIHRLEAFKLLDGRAGHPEAACTHRSCRRLLQRRAVRRAGGGGGPVFQLAARVEAFDKGDGIAVPCFERDAVRLGQDRGKLVHYLVAGIGVARERKCQRGNQHKRDARGEYLHNFVPLPKSLRF